MIFLEQSIFRTDQSENKMLWLVSGASPPLPERLQVSTWEYDPHFFKKENFPKTCCRVYGWTNAARYSAGDLFDYLAANGAMPEPAAVTLMLLRSENERFLLIPLKLSKSSFSTRQESFESRRISHRDLYVLVEMRLHVIGMSDQVKDFYRPIKWM